MTCYELGVCTGTYPLHDSAASDSRRQFLAAAVAAPKGLVDKNPCALLSQWLAEVHMHTCSPGA